MIEKVITEIINDLGPTGLLIIGVYYVAGKHMAQIAKHIKTINEELGEIRDLLKTKLE